jgi:hypothetical protein
MNDGTVAEGQGARRGDLPGTTQAASRSPRSFSREPGADLSGSVADWRRRLDRVDADDQTFEGCPGTVGSVVQRSAVHRRGDPVGGPVVSDVSDQLP